jgi:hypothetical protein
VRGGGAGEDGIRPTSRDDAGGGGTGEDEICPTSRGDAGEDGICPASRCDVGECGSVRTDGGPIRTVSGSFIIN